MTAFATTVLFTNAVVADIADGACDCDGNVLDECGVCGGTGVDADMDGGNVMTSTTVAAKATLDGAATATTRSCTGCADENP